MNEMARELLASKERGDKNTTQRSLWKKFITKNELKIRYLCHLIQIMFSIPPNTGWVERAYSLLELICQKRRNQVSDGTLKELFFLAVLKLQPKDCFSYDKEIDNMCA